MKEQRASETAVVVCFLRATDRLRAPADRLLDDPQARSFLPAPYRAALGLVGATGLLRLSDRSFTGLTGFIVVRHRFIDDALRIAVERGLDQVVLLGAGYDSRAFRFAEQLRGVKVFEVDHPATSARKHRVVERHGDRWPSADVTRVVVDFERDQLSDCLIDAGFAPGRRTFWIWEGVSMYLRRKAVEATLSLVRGLSGPGSRLAMDLWFLPDEPTWQGTFWRSSPALLHLLGEPFTFQMHPEDAPAWLAASGHRVVDLARPEELVRRYVKDGRTVAPCAFLVTTEW